MDSVTIAVARAIAAKIMKEPDVHLAAFIPAAQAAIAAMKAQMVPVAYRYDCVKPVGDRKHLDPPIHVAHRMNMDPRYWTETPLYALPTPPKETDQ